MKKTFLTLLMAVAAVVTVQAQQPTTTPPVNDNPNAPEISFENDVVDYGTIEYNSNGEREFKFKNTGKEPLIIQSATGSCGCTVPTPPKEPIKPGETGVIKVKYDTKRVGSFEKTITVMSNAKSGTKIIRIKGQVKADPNANQPAPNTPVPAPTGTTPK
ncbi:MAG: DUF1573 domain-containing protein [Bacteroidia bacterium]|nr:DUF1573 domain-containing protein [Bacteroidia bacterium]